VSLKQIMLGMLRKPHSGYDIRKEFQYSVNNFWRAELSQIYPLLQKMEREGLLSSEESASDIGPTKRVYRRTEKGRRELEEWLSGGPTLGKERIAYLAQTYFLASLQDDEKAIAFLDELRSYFAEWLESLEQTEREWRSSDPRYPDLLPDEDFYAQLTLDMGLMRVRGNLQWCERSIARIRHRQAASAVSRIAGDQPSPRGP
jgi:DNA-binding PadR family transcriptional regulator